MFYTYIKETLPRLLEDFTELDYHESLLGFVEHYCTENDQIFIVDEQSGNLELVYHDWVDFMTNCPVIFMTLPINRYSIITLPDGTSAKFVVINFADCAARGYRIC